MNELVPIVLVFVVTYVIGGIPFGLLIGRINGIDVRQAGSGNIGATNVVRTCGKRWGYLCFGLDFLKGLVPVFIAVSIAGSHGWAYSAYVPVAAIPGVVSGHVWCPYLRFKGGKGVATSAGAILAVAPLAVLAALCVWYVTFMTTRYVSLASVAAALAMPLVALVFFLRTDPRMQANQEPTLLLLFILAFLIVIKHRTNIERWVAGNENRFERRRNGDKVAS